jgi:hypothetical protein
MSTSRNSLLGGPAYAGFNSKTIQFVGDTSVIAEGVWDDIETALYWKINKVYRDLVVKAKGTPRFYDTAVLATMFPYIGVPSSSFYVGVLFPGASALPLTWNANNGDLLTASSALVGKMPDFQLGMGSPTLGEMEFWCVLPYGDDVATANSYFEIQTGQSYSAAAQPTTAVVGNQEFTAAWGSVTGFTSFQARERWTISHELELEPVVVQGRTRAFKFNGYRCMAKCIPVGPTMANIDAALLLQGTGALQGMLLTANASNSNLVLTGAASMTVTIGNAGMVSEGFMFGGKPLRNGEIGFVSNLVIPSTAGYPTQAPLTLA